MRNRTAPAKPGQVYYLDLALRITGQDPSALPHTKRAPSIKETAKVLGASVETIISEWRPARVWLGSNRETAISGFHVKDAEFHPSGRVGVCGGYQSWAKRAGRFRSLGDGQVDFKRVFTLLTEAGFDGWAVLEWECCVKSPEQGAADC